MSPIHLAGEMAVWSEESWAAFEGDLQRRLRAERLAVRRQRVQALLMEVAIWGVFAAAIVLVPFYR
ncbi:MAG TPA: hypothetical protein VLW55_07740 [Burkholderiaceae bacterium]|nr:hypothetical protein [Burkholderiaceae bacterium]